MNKERYAPAEQELLAKMRAAFSAALFSALTQQVSGAIFFHRMNRIEVACLISTLPDASGADESRRKENMPKDAVSENSFLGTG